MEKMIEIELLHLLNRPYTALTKLLGTPIESFREDLSQLYIFNKEDNRIILKFLNNQLREFQLTKFFPGQASLNARVIKLRLRLQKEGFKLTRTSGAQKFILGKKTIEISRVKYIADYRVFVKGYEKP